ncbi:integral membrane protein [Exophiala viscosa]|uniref:Integral membrane protein n=1 Tax=Exophiala viscosa TaxID=2486360 RepID=A0AAN6DTT9_9EURO|nr:integral membrane protein [Exophiala viscosa]
MTRYFYDCRVRNDNVVEISRPNGDEQLEISFKRTVRIPDNRDKFNLPPDMGNFPLYKTEQYAQSLPESIVAKRGIFLPMYQLEAMWINFEATAPFAVKVYAGSINAVSGQPVAKSDASKVHPQSLVSQKASVQDYVVVPGQKWLDGFATDNGLVRQFVATKLGDGYTVEAQVTAQEVYGGLQIEVTPAVVTGQDRQSPVQASVKTLHSLTLHIDNLTTVEDLKKEIRARECIPEDQQRCIFGGKQMVDHATVFSYTGGIKDAAMQVVLRLRGGGTVPGAKSMEMGLAAGGSIKQVIVPDGYPVATWHKSATIVFNVQLLDAANFEAVTGLLAPETPITMDTYAELGLPFFKLHEHPSGVHASFEQVKSVGEMIGTKEQTVKVPVHHINKPTAVNVHDQPRKNTPDTKVADITNPAGPLEDFRHIAELAKELRLMKLAKSDDQEDSDGQGD